MKKIVGLMLFLSSIYAEAFVGRYDIQLPFQIVELEIKQDKSIKIHNDTFNQFHLSHSINSNKLDLAISWLNDGSPEMARILIQKSIDNKLVIDQQNSLIIYNDGTPSVESNSIKLIKYDLK
jgi:hypothetical protein